MAAALFPACIRGVAYDLAERCPLVKTPMRAFGPFDSIYTHGFVRVAVCTPRVAIAEPMINLERTLELARGAADPNAALEVLASGDAH